MATATRCGCLLLIGALSLWSLLASTTARSTGAAVPGPATSPATQEAPAADRGFRRTDDFFLAEQWGLFNFGQTVGGWVRGTRNADIHAPEAWAVTMGSREVVVAVLDGGIAYDHPDLAPNVWTNPGEMGDGKDANGVDDDGNGFVDDWRGWDFIDGDNDPRDVRGASILSPGSAIAHGTAVASVIGAAGDNARGMTGVSPRVGLLAVRVSEGDDAALIEAIAYAVAMGAKVVNMSFGTFIPGMGMPTVAAAMAAAPDVLFVTASGNGANDVEILGSEPCSLPAANLICVAATDQEDRLVTLDGWGSNFGATSVDLGAPGANVLVAQPAVETILAESFEAPLAGRWETGGTGAAWGISEAAATDGRSSLSDSPDGNYQAGTDSWVRLAEPLDLRDRSDCRIDVRARHFLGGANDLGSLELSLDGEQWNGVLGAFGMTLFGSTQGEFVEFSVGLDPAPELYVGFRLIAGEDSPGGDGAYIDDLRVTCASSTYEGREYGYAEGTSMAAPFVSGAAALVLAAYPDLTAEQVREAILAGVDVVPDLVDKTVTAGRLNVFGALRQAERMTPAADQETSAVASDAEAPARRPEGPATMAGGMLLEAVLPRWLVPRPPPPARNERPTAGYRDSLGGTVFTGEDGWAPLPGSTDRRCLTGSSWCVAYRDAHPQEPMYFLLYCSRTQSRCATLFDPNGDQKTFAVQYAPEQINLQIDPATGELVFPFMPGYADSNSSGVEG